MQKYLDFKEAKCKNCYKCLKICPVKAIKITIYIEDNKQIFFIINQTLHLLVFAKHCEFVYYCIPIKKTVQGLNL